MKRFNTTGICVPRKHYMVNINKKLDEIEDLVNDEFYFVINRPRQYGKTTTLSELAKRLNNKFKLIRLSFEATYSDFESEERFCNSFVESIGEFLLKDIPKVSTFRELTKVIKDVTKNEEVILIIDEVDRASNNKLFLSFLGMLRALYLEREMGLCTTFKSVILAGVYDIKNLKLKFRDGEDTRYNSPWNIAVEFNVDMSFGVKEIMSMLNEYSKDNTLNMDVKSLSEELHKFTGGYPFLVSRLCQIIDEKIIVSVKRPWSKKDIHKAIKMILEEKNTLFDDLIKNLENNNNLYEFIHDILLLNNTQLFNLDNPIIDLGNMFGYFTKDENNNVIISNQIIKERIYNYMISKTNNKTMARYNFKNNFINDDNGLDIEKILLKFQQFMRENYSNKDVEFLERQGVLLFLAFIKPIINGVGFDYKEVQISEEKRLDIVIQYNNHKYIIETKIWYGEKAHKRGIGQLKDYLEIENLDKGYLLIFNFSKNKEYLNKEYFTGEKLIFEVMV